MLLVLLKK